MTSKGPRHSLSVSSAEDCRGDDGVDRRLTVLDDRHLGAGFSQQKGDQPLVVGAVFGQQDAAVESRLSAPGDASAGPRSPTPLRPGRSHRHAVQRAGIDGDGERRGAAGLAADADIAPQQIRQALADRQPQPAAAEAAAGRGIGLGERLEQSGDLLGAHADARVDHVELQQRRLSLFASQAGDDANLAEFGELDGVADQVDKIATL